MQKLTKATPGPSLGIPEANRWIPTKLDLVFKTHPHRSLKSLNPDQIIDAPEGEAYYAVDHEYEVPSVFWSFSLLTPEVNREMQKKLYWRTST